MPANQDSDFELSDWSKDIDPPVEALTREEAQALIARNPSMSVWQVVAAQALFGAEDEQENGADLGLAQVRGR